MGGNREEKDVEDRDRIGVGGMVVNISTGYPLRICQLKIRKCQ